MNYLCCVCDNRAMKSSQFCKDCEVIYSAVENEDWFVELTKLMKKQRRIDNMEKYSIYDLGEIEMNTRFKRNRGRPKTSMVVTELISNIKTDRPRVSIRSIEEMCKKLDIVISRETIRRILTQK
jgi:hypothetical protein